MQSLVRKAQLTREEFMRELPTATNDAPWTQQGHAIVITPAHGQRVTVTLTDLGIEKKGALELPMLRVEFQFEGMPEDAIEAFMETWDANKMRMGG